MTASPQPKIEPGRRWSKPALLKMSVEWFLLKADRTCVQASRGVLQKRVTTRHLRAARIRFLIAHQLGRRRQTISGVSPASDAGQSMASALLAEYPLSQLAYGQMADGRKGLLVMRVKDETGNVVVFDE